MAWLPSAAEAFFSSLPSVCSFLSSVSAALSVSLALALESFVVSFADAELSAYI
jgi:hypothetical protein